MPSETGRCNPYRFEGSGHSFFFFIEPELILESSTILKLLIILYLDNIKHMYFPHVVGIRASSVSFIHHSTLSSSQILMICSYVFFSHSFFFSVIAHSLVCVFIPQSSKTSVNFLLPFMLLF